MTLRISPEQMTKVKDLIVNPLKNNEINIQIVQPLRDYPIETPIVVKNEPTERFNGKTLLATLPMIHSKLWMKTHNILEVLKIFTVDDFQFRSHELETHDDITTRQLAIIHRAVETYRRNTKRLLGE